MKFEDAARMILHGLPPQEKRAVTVYVRKGDHAKERTISINPVPVSIDDPLDLINAGFALDGNSATISVDPYTYVTHHIGEHTPGLRGLRMDLAGTHVVSFERWVPGSVLPGDWAVTWTLTKAVNVVEEALVDWLQAIGYEVKFG